MMIPRTADFRKQILPLQRPKTRRKPSIYGNVATKSHTLTIKIAYPLPVYKIGAGPYFGLGGDDVLAQAEFSPRVFEAFSVFLP